MSTAPSRGIGTITHPKLRKPGKRAELVGYKQRHALDETSVFKVTFRAEKTAGPAANEIGGASDIVLWGASSCGDLAKVRRAIQGGVNPSAEDPTGRTAAHQAAISDQLAVVAFLAEARADLNKGDQQGLTPLHVCRSRAVAGSLLRHGANPWALSKERLTPAEYLTKKGFVEVAAFITESCGE